MTSTEPATKGLLVVGDVTMLLGDTEGTTLTGVNPDMGGLGLRGLPGSLVNFKVDKGVPWSDIWRKNPCPSSPDLGLGVCCAVVVGVSGGVTMETGLCDVVAVTVTGLLLPAVVACV